MMMVREKVRNEVVNEGEKVMSGEIDYKKAYEESRKKYKRENPLISQIMSISTEQIRIGRELNKTLANIKEGSHSAVFSQSSIALLEKSYSYNEKMKYDFMVAYCDELWRELRSCMQNMQELRAEDEDGNELGQLLTNMRQYLVTIKNTLRRGEGWDKGVMPALTDLNTRFVKFEKELDSFNCPSISRETIENYREIACYYIDAYFFGLNLESYLRELRVFNYGI